jgi:hypothetical protein
LNARAARLTARAAELDHLADTYAEMALYADDGRAAPFRALATQARNEASRLRLTVAAPLRVGCILFDDPPAGVRYSKR